MQYKNNFYIFEVREDDGTSLPETFSTSYKAEHRAREHYNSRAALKSLSAKFTELGAHELDVINHHYLRLFPEIKVSFSHTKKLAAAIISCDQGINSIGIDLEYKNRIIKKNIEKFYLNEHDREKDLLKLWCLKEAAFKAIFPLYQHHKKLVLKDIIIEGENFKLSLNLDPIKRCRGKCFIHQDRDNEIIIATAII